MNERSGVVISSSYVVLGTPEDMVSVVIDHVTGTLRRGFLNYNTVYFVLNAA